MQRLLVYCPPSDREIHAPPPQNGRSTSQVQNWGRCVFCIFLRFRQFAHHPPQKYHLMRKVFCGDGAWLAVPYPSLCYLSAWRPSTKKTRKKMRGTSAEESLVEAYVFSRALPLLLPFGCWPASRNSAAALVAQCSATPATVAATTPCSATPFQTQISVRHLPARGGGATPKFLGGVARHQCYTCKTL